MSLQNIYIARKQATEFAHKIKQALNKPANFPVLHYAYGIGGIGKTTLLTKIAESYANDCQCIKVSCDRAANESIYIDSPIRLMQIIDQELSGNVFLGSSPFQDIYKKRKQTLDELEQSPVEGEKQVTPEQIEEVKKFARVGAKGIGLIATVQTDGGVASSRVISPIAERAADFTVDTMAMGLKAYNLLKKHQATKNKPELQQLVENPLPQFAKAIIQTLIKKSQAKPILLLIDTYEKATPDFDTFLCRFLLSDEQLRHAPFKIFIAGRYPLNNQKYNRIFQRHENAISEIRLDKFDQPGTKKYLQEIGITEPKLINKIWKATKGYPYYLNLIRKQKNSGKEIKLVRGGQDMVDLLMDDLTDVERKVVRLAAYCRWFDRAVIEYLLEQNKIEQQPQNTSWFDWLVNRDFTINEESHRFDDVARDVIRQTEHNDNKRGFYQIHQQLAEYFQQEADHTVTVDELVNEKYEDPEWCEYAIESTYHALYADKKQGQIKLLTHFFEGAYLKEPEVAKQPFIAVMSETAIDELKLLPGNTKSFLQSITSAILFGWRFIENNPERYKINLESEEEVDTEKRAELFKASIESSLGKCFKEVEKLAGIAKCFGLIGQCIRSKKIRQELSLLNLAQIEIEKIGAAQYPKIGNIIFINRGRVKDNLGIHEEALIDFTQAIGLDANDSITWKHMGDAKLKLGRYEEALIDYDKAIELDKDNSNIWNNCGVIKRKLGRYEEALVDYDRAIELDEDDSDIWSNRGNAKRDLGRYEEALADHNQAIKLDKDNSSAWLNRGVTNRDLKKHEEALSDHNQAIKLDKNSSNAWINRGIAKHNLGRYGEAIIDYNQAIRLDKYNSNAWINRGNAKRDLGRYEEALADHNQAIELDKDNSNAWLNRGITNRVLKKYEEALSDHDQAIEIDKDNSNAWINRGIAKHNSGRYKEALSSYNRAIELNPYIFDAWMNRGSTNGDLGRYEEALDDFDQAIELDSNNSIAWTNRGVAKYIMSRYEEAVADCNQAIELDSNNSIAYNSRALNLGVQGKFEQAISDIDQAIKLEPKAVAYIANKGIILARQGEFYQAKEWIEQAESMDGDREYVYYAKACFFALQNQEKEAIKNLEEAISIAPFRCKREAKHNPDFDLLRDNPEFKALIDS